MTSIDAYVALDTWVPAFIAALLIVLSVISVIVGDLVKQYVPRFFIEIIQLNLPDLKAKQHSKVKIDGKDINPTAVVILSLFVVPLTVSTTFLTFWNVYLVEEEVRGDCVQNFDCFPVRHGNYIQNMPVDNCSQLFDLGDASDANDTMLANSTSGANTDNGDMEMHYECYRFVFRYAEGIGAAGGVLLFTAVFSKLYFGLLVAITKIEHHDIYVVVLLFTVWILAGVLLLLFVLVNSAVPLFREAVFQTVTDIIQFIMYALNFLMLVVCGIVVTLGIGSA